MSIPKRRILITTIAAILILPVLSPKALGQFGRKRPNQLLQRRLYVATVQSVEGALLQRRLKQWFPAKIGARLIPGTTLVSFPKSVIRSKNGAVEVLMLSDLGGEGLYPILETAIKLKKNVATDLHFELERGLVVLTNKRTDGPAKVRVQVRYGTGEITLEEPGSQVVLELYSRHPPGLPPLGDLKENGPATNLTLLVVKGKARLTTPKLATRLSAPPGPALVFWNNLQDVPEVQRLEALPPRARSPEDEAKLLKQISTCISCVMTGPIGPALEKLVESENKTERLVGVTMLGAVDDLPRLIACLEDSKHPDVRSHAIVVLRNWMGRERGQVRKLFTALVKTKKYRPVQALSIIQLLFGFNEEQHRRPALYQLLIHSLNNKSLAIRELAHWNLVRHAPQGKDIPYDAAAPEEQRLRAIREWQRLLPPGRTPEDVQSEGESKQKRG